MRHTGEVPTEASPLTWPIMKPRTPAAARKLAKFGHRGRGATVIDAGDLLLHELALLRAEDAIISSNSPRYDRDGVPTAGREVSDPGVAVYFRMTGIAHVLACDRWTRLADNMMAIGKHIEALRGQVRWGVGDLAQAFAGHRALTAAAPVRPWWAVMGFPAATSDLALLEMRRRALAHQHHPDRGGNANTMAEINAAYDEGRREIERVRR